MIEIITLRVTLVITLVVCDDLEVERSEGTSSLVACAIEIIAQVRQLWRNALRAGINQSFMVSVDYRVYMGSSSRIRSFRRLFLYLCSYKLVGSVTTSLVS